MRILLKGPFTYLDDLRVNKTAYSLLIGISLNFKRQLWPEKKLIFRAEFERKGTLKHFDRRFSAIAAQKN